MTSDNRTLRASIHHALIAQGNRTATVLSSLLAVEDAFGYIPREAISEVAELTHSSVNDVWAVASFYTNFRFTPPGKHVVEVCWGPSCHVSGATSILKGALDSLGLAGEGDTPDGDVTFKYSTCLGSCAQAPMMSVDHRLVGKVTPEEARRRITELRSGQGSDVGG
ncbi:MAG: NAD(P)H-dependent oxidoreductase subunit E [Dehalococcoidia bacterium]